LLKIICTIYIRSQENVKPQKVVIVGQGYVGLPIAMRAVEVGYSVVGIDLDIQRIEMLNAGRSYVEDISDSTLSAAKSSGRFLASNDYQDALNFDVAVIAVPTPLRESLPDLSFIESAARSLSHCLSRHATVVLESTTYPGTTEEILVPLLEGGSGFKADVDFFVGYSPERIDPGNKTWGFVETPKVVSGISAVSLSHVQTFYDRLVMQTVPVSGTKEAELTKLLENTFRHVNIALVNELAVFAHKLEINVWEAIDAASTKPFGFMKFTPGPGVGGHCLPVDPSYLSWEVKRKLGRSFRFVEVANDVNEHMPDYVVNRLISMLNDRGRALRDAKVLLVGLAYKRNTGDTREAPSRRIVELLREYGADVSAVDPHVDDLQWPKDVARADALDDSVVNQADAVVIITDHDAIALDPLLNRPDIVLDTRNCMHNDSVSVL
jgi:nucleotide sugar dehydrogenase